MRIVENKFGKIYVWSFGLTMNLDTDTHDIVDCPKWMFWMEVDLFRCHYCLEIHSSKTK